MSIYYKETGNMQGEIIVFIHGGGISGWMWNKQLEYFKDYHCIVPDLPEHGNSSDKGPISLKNSADLIAEIIDQKADGKKVNIVGHSLGAKIVIELLNSRSDIIDHAVVASGLFRNIPYMKFFHRKSIYKLTIDMLKVNWIVNFQAKQFKFPDKESTENLIKDFQSMTPDMMYRIYDELYNNLTIPEGLKDVNVPTLVIAGEKEMKEMKQSVIDVISVLSNSRGLLMKNGVHTYPWVMYKDFNEITYSWINDRTIDNENIVKL